MEEITLNIIKKEQKHRVKKNNKQIKAYYLKNNASNFICSYENEQEKQIIFMIKHFVSINFITQYFNTSPDYVKKLATKHKCCSQISSNFTENINARCFSKNQILRACEDFNYICPMCFKALDITNIQSLTGHHIQPFAIGGKTTKDNCLPLHASCHFADFKLLHSALFNSEDPIYSAKYFNFLKERLKSEKSGIDFVLDVASKIK